jgi:hypothetical protein
MTDTLILQLTQERPDRLTGDQVDQLRALAGGSPEALAPRSTAWGPTAEEPARIEFQGGLRYLLSDGEFVRQDD